MGQHRFGRAGMPPLGYRAVPLLGEGHRFDSVLDAIRYRNHQNKAELLLLGRKGQIWSVPTDGMQGNLKRYQLANLGAMILKTDVMANHRTETFSC